MTSNSQGSIFQKNYEVFNLTLPFIFLAGILWEWFFKIRLSGQDQRHLVQFASIFLLNANHVILTPLMFIIFPELNEWKSKKSKFQFISSSFSKIFITIFLFALAIHFMPLDGRRISLGLITVVSSFIGIQHNIFQTYGFLCLYDSSVKGEPIRSQPLKKYFRMMHLLIFAQFFLINTEIASETILKPLAIITFAIAAWIVFKISREPNGIKSYKFVYSLRILLVALIPNSTIAFAGYLAAHGIEYFLLFLKMGRQSELKKVNQAIVTYSALTLLLLASIPVILGKGFITISFEPSIEAILASYLISMSLTHYFIDGQLFQFRKKENQIHILPLVS